MVKEYILSNCKASACLILGKNLRQYIRSLFCGRNPLQIDIAVIVRFTLNNNRTKYIHRRFNFACEVPNNGGINLQRILGTEQAADVSTKILPQDQARRSLTIAPYVLLYNSSLTNSTSHFYSHFLSLSQVSKCIFILSHLLFQSISLQSRSSIRFSIPQSTTPSSI